MNLKTDILKKKFGKNLIINENLSKYSWFNLGGPAKIFFKPDNTDQLISFLKQVNNSYKISCLGAGSNTLIRDGGFEGIIIKLSPKFSFIKKNINNKLLEVGAATLDKKLSSYALNECISGFEFLSCIPGSIGGAIIMNSGCYGDNISNILHSINVVDLKGQLSVIKKADIEFHYRGTSLPHNIIILSANFIIKNEKKNLIENKMQKYIEEKKKTQPSQVKTCGSTFKNPKNMKAWKLIKDSECCSLSFGEASISEKHSNFFVNNGNATAKDIEKLINFVKEKVFNKHKIRLDLEINIIGENKL